VTHDPRQKRSLKRLGLLSLPPFFVLSLFLFLFSTSIVYAQDIDLTEIPQNLADATGIPLFAGKLLCSAILLFMFILPLVVLTRRKGTGYIAELFVGFMVMGVCVALQWLPYWIIIVLLLIVAGTYASKIKGVFGGD